MEGRVDFKELERNQAFSILIFLYRNGRSMKSTLYEISKTNTLPSKISYLIGQGLVTEDQRRFENNTKYIDLTERGRRVAEKISEIEDLILGLEPKETDVSIDTIMPAEALASKRAENAARGGGRKTS